MNKLLVIVVVALAALLLPSLAVAGGDSWSEWAQYQEIVVIADLASDKPAETLVANLHTTSGGAVEGAERRFKRRALPAKVDPKTVSFTCPPFTDLGDLVPAASAYSLSPDGTKLALLTKKVPRVRVTDESGTSSVLVFDKHSAEHLEWSGDGAWFALGEAVDKRTRVIVAELSTKATHEVMVDAPVLRLRFSGDASTLYALAPNRLYAIELKPGATAKVVLERPGLHWLEPGPKRLVFLGDEDAYLLVDPARPAAEATTVYTPRDRGRVLAAEWTGDGRAVFVSHADTRQTCLADGKPLVWEHSRAELLRIDVDAGRASPLMQYPALPAPLKGRVLDASDRPLISALWRSPDGTHVAALSREKLFVFDAKGSLVYDAAGGSAMRWRRDGKALLLTTGDAVLSLDTTTWEERLLTAELPIDVRTGTRELALLEPDFLGKRLIYTVFRVAGKPEDEP